MKKYWQILDALDIPARIDFTRVRYGEMSEADGQLVGQVMELVNARFPDVYADPAWDKYMPIEDRPLRGPVEE
ncbi:hypothetical protein [Citricoccus muralis]|uniref:Uncharacterized protein n=1 Tax=Citricoccus muralis TaxID=169134 RepID=A0ABY8H2K2_9MICC|nr:hypothetical protein [Citricoccus muralis]WFP15241.1 hypothetical protein P8192_07285 [Citricoccus muralis]